MEKIENRDFRKLRIFARPSGTTSTTTLWLESTSSMTYANVHMVQRWWITRAMTHKRPRRPETCFDGELGRSFRFLVAVTASWQGNQLKHEIEPGTYLSRAYLARSHVPKTADHWESLPAEAVAPSVSEVLEPAVLTTSSAEPCQFLPDKGGKSFLHDGLVVGSDDAVVADFLEQLKQAFKVAVGTLENYLGMKIVCDKDGISTSHARYTRRILERSGVADASLEAQSTPEDDGSF